jgi:tetratricopeptide (TPR) repeat protein
MVGCWYRSYWHRHLNNRYLAVFDPDWLFSILMIPVSRWLLLPLLSIPALTQNPSPAPPSAPAAQPAPAAEGEQKPNRAAAYYHYALARNYEELASLYGRSEYAAKAVEQYRLAIQNDPESEFLNAGLAELYAKTNRIRDAVIEAQNILKRDPNNVSARKLLGRIYLRSLGDMQAGSQSNDMLRLAIDQYEHLLRLEPKNIDHYLLLGRLYILNKDLLKAESSFKSALQVQPGAEEAIINLAYLYNEQGESKRATTVLTSVPDSSRSAKLFSALGYTYEQQHEYKNAVDAYSRAVDLDPENLDAVRGLAQNLLNDGRYEEALKQFNTVAKEDPNDPQALLRISEIHRRLGKLDVALQTLKKAESLVPDSLEVPYNIAMVYEAQGRYDEAIQTLGKLLDRTAKAEGRYTATEASNRAVFLDKLAGVYHQMGKPQLAVETYQRMIGMTDETSSRGYQQIINTYRENKQWELATKAAEDAVAKMPNDRNLKLVLAAQYSDTGKAERGIQIAKSLLKTGPEAARENRETYLALSQIYTRLKMWDKAEDAALQAEKLSAGPDDTENAVFMRAAVYERQKKYEQAEEQFRRVLATDPQNAPALNYLGYMLADRGVRLDEAIGMIKRALEIDPQNGAYLDSLGWAYYKLGNYELAEENLRKAVTRSSSDATLHDHLAELYHKTGKLKLAVAHWERALEEWHKSVAADVEQADVARVQKKLESTKVRLAKQQQSDKSN